MAAALFAEMLEHLQHTTQLNPESQSCIVMSLFCEVSPVFDLTVIGNEISLFLIWFKICSFLS
jgi:hypothetical protein